MGGGSSKSKKKLPPKGAASTSIAPAPVLKAPSVPSLLALNSARWEAESRSDPGFGSEEDDNQDVVLVDHLEELGAFVVGVFDGHGPSGRQVAQTCRAHLCDAIRKYVPSGEVGEACDWLERCFQSLENRVRRDLSDRLAESGAAGTVLVYLPARKLLYAANVGDSKAILIDGGAAPPPLASPRHPAAGSPSPCAAGRRPLDGVAAWTAWRPAAPP
ncbi:hypothetical protein AB1Y20_014491 [Prymnesium parvum]|uniref:PPM-type phosphatase domain-containing protein n=1 Tax=Prymnesium parvum TaxID=97485 RepID=A0AB34IEH5_PRYPA